MAGRDPLSESGGCVRTREWVSLRLDDELSALEEELLERHLAVCDACRAFEKDVRWVSDVVRLTPQERPSRRVVLPTRRRERISGRRLTAVAAAAALAAGALAGAVVERPSSPGPASHPTEVSLLTDGILIPKAAPTKILAPVDPVPAIPSVLPKGVI
jgi:hypothetical protein